jgi:hypothetical protein
MSFGKADPKGLLRRCALFRKVAQFRNRAVFSVSLFKNLAPFHERLLGIAIILTNTFLCGVLSVFEKPSRPQKLLIDSESQDCP